MGYYKPFGPEILRGQRFGDNPGWGPNPPGGHNGDDYLSQVGTPVHAAGDGVVVFAGRFDSTYADNWGWNLNFGGQMVVLNLDGAAGPYVEYGHNSELQVKTGDRVAGGQVIALSGADDGGTHVITGPHLHVGCLPPNFDLGTNTYGRVDPDIYLTDYWSGGAITPQSSTITPQEDTLSQAEVDQITANVDSLIAKHLGEYGKVASPDGQTVNIVAALGTLLESSQPVAMKEGAISQRQVLAWNNANLGYILNVLASLPASVLNQQFKLADGTATNIAGILDTIHAKPAGVTNVTGPVLDIDALVARLKAELPAAVLSELTIKLSK